MCYTSKYPEVIALKRVDPRTVADGMIEVSHTGIPDMDRGSVFMGELNTPLQITGHFLVENISLSSSIKWNA